jgi:hypothetical protein
LVELAARAGVARDRRIVTGIKIAGYPNSKDDGSWLCHRGREEFDFHAQLDDAIEHTIGIASEDLPSEAFVHHRDGRVQTIATLD